MGRKENPVQLGSESLKVGSRLRQLRQAQGLGLGDLAARLGYSKPYLSAVENGTAKPAQTIVSAYAKAFGVPVDTLLPGEWAPASPEPPVSPQLDASVVRIAQEFGLSANE